ncbi:response regulator transcription factor [Paucilactobacillus suebicus]|uniref:Winged helix family two component transcriptional regulator n=1 Tax=Paucilactobacillus suebicus DSM 5007 = KCTC 3549 TaxID=1423807 RepID=A0A0R1W480_9LACO|nr:response regulator transcription factor [Paucilactobacillus suebicus]KRM12303.1 winged helix family two component transcriptional regulator [Paucilactobacillus suebicus DSM 5007 = KCTC 3549]
MSTILLVEDEDSLVSYLQTELKFENYEVLVAGDGLEALDIYRDNAGNIDLILLDWMLPKLDGLRVMKKIRETDDIPIIMMTAKDYVGDKVAGLDNGADDYITKPFEIEELLARIRVIIRHLDTKPVDKERIYRVNGLVLDTKARSVKQEDQLISLTQREYNLLLVLMQHVNQVLTRDELLNLIWGVDFEGDPNIVDVYVRYVRGKIDTSDQSIIKTIRGIGYSLRDR